MRQYRPAPSPTSSIPSAVQDLASPSCADCSTPEGRRKPDSAGNVAHPYRPLLGRPAQMARRGARHPSPGTAVQASQAVATSARRASGGMRAGSSENHPEGVEEPGTSASPVGQSPGGARVHRTGPRRPYWLHTGGSYGVGHLSRMAPSLRIRNVEHRVRIERRAAGKPPA